MFINSLGIDQSKVYSNRDMYNIFKLDPPVYSRTSKPLTSLYIDTFNLIKRVIEKFQICEKHRDINITLHFVSTLILLLESEKSSKFIMTNGSVIIKRKVDKLVIKDINLSNVVFVYTNNHICITIYEVINYIYTRIYSLNNFRLKKLV